MMRSLHWINCLAWVANSAMWALYAHSPMVAVAMVAGAGIAAFLAWHADPYDSVLARRARRA